jgi:sigma-B regulation protein RsbU (phosphoserine phosphatase)
MRDKIYLFGFLILAGLLLFAGRALGLFQPTVMAVWGLTFAGTTGVGVLGMTLYRVQAELRASRQELARKDAEISFAREVQEALFPRQLPKDSGLEFSATCVPARGISGDYYDVLGCPNGRVVFAIADISGKGISAAILMSNLHAVLRVLVGEGRSPKDACSQINRQLYEVTQGSRFATIFYAEWSLAERRLRFVNAGHTPPLLFTADGSKTLPAAGPPLGLFPNVEIEVGETALQTGDLLLCCSDGITEAGSENEREFGESRLAALVAGQLGKPLDVIQAEVLRAVRAWAGPEPEDDMTLMLVRATGGALPASVG